MLTGVSLLILSRKRVTSNMKIASIAKLRRHHWVTILAIVLLSLLAAAPHAAGH